MHVQFFICSRMVAFNKAEESTYLADKLMTQGDQSLNAETETSFLFPR